ncbi:MAG TPA: hypothetical protein VGM87_13900 [Roseomonas sp.]|jgi:hypothetical protein
MADEPKISFIDNPHAPDVFADEVSGVFLHRGVARITFASARVNHSTVPGPINRVVIGRLIMPAQSAAELAVQLFDFLKNNGIEVPGLRREGQTVQ